MKRTKKNFNNICVCFLCLGVVILPSVPQIDSISSIVFIVLYAVSCLQSFFSVSRTGSIDKISLLIIIIIIFLLPANLLVATNNDISPTYWVRSTIWILFLYSYIIMYSSGVEYYKIYNILLLSCILWVLKIIIMYYSEMILIINGNLSRLSYLVPDVLVPVSLVGFSLALFHPNKKNIFIITSTLLFLIMVIFSGYRSQIAICLILLYIRFRPLRSIYGFVVILLFVIAFIFIFSFSSLPVFSEISTRFSGLTSEFEGVRYRELVYAYNKFIDRPVFGQGLGAEIPVYLTRQGIAVEKLGYDSIRYIHNITAYIMMTMGVAGLLSFCYVYVLAGKKMLKNRKDGYVYGAMVTLISLLVFFHVSASFKQIQTMMIFSMLLFIATRRSCLERSKADVT